MSQAKSVLDAAKTAALAAAGVLMRYYGKAEIHQKSSQNLVTQADFESEQRVSEIIEERFPGHAIMREETASTGGVESEHLWIVDPLDGTNNYAHGVPQFCVSIAYAFRGEVQVGVVLDPTRDEMFTAVRGAGAWLNGQPIRVTDAEDLRQCMVATGFYYERGAVMEKTLKAIGALFRENTRGVRRMGAAALDLSWVACGRFGAYFEYRLSPWDFAAGWLIVSEAGGRLVDQNGAPLQLDSAGLICAAPAVFDRFVEIVAEDKVGR